ncbi:MAG TPA: NADP-dependent malic enzyme [Thermoplasmatales archaeon]|nr:NADP-dependent malic enzyme [Thermoplasmatales archaeon]
MEKKVTVEELLEKAKKPAQDAMKLHPFYRGKVQVTPKCAIRDFNDFGIWYTPGVAEPCRDIAKDPEKVFEHTNKANFVAVASDGTRVLGLGDIGPLAGLPVMEGKALLFKYLGGVDAFPLMIDTKDPDEFIQAVKWASPTFGGINLEDISSPKCFYILDRLREELDIPVWHDDQQGTAAITLAGVINGLKIVGKKLNEVLFSIIGAGAANICLIRTLIKAGVPPRNIIAVDSKGILHPNRADIETLKEKNPYKYKIAMETNGEGREGDMAEAIRDTDVCIAASKPGPGTIKKEWVEKMNHPAVMFAEANPVPEIWPWEAKEAGVKVFGTGRSDFPNQVNNSLGFPGIFRGTLDVMAKTITDEMHIAAAYAIAEVAERKGLREDYIVPTMDDWEVFPYEATQVALKAIEQGIARKKMSRQEIYEKAEETIKSAREQAQAMMKYGFIKLP